MAARAPTAATSRAAAAPRESRHEAAGTPPAAVRLRLAAAATTADARKQAAADRLRSRWRRARPDREPHGGASNVDRRAHRIEHGLPGGRRRHGRPDRLRGRAQHGNRTPALVERAMTE